jgi:hypothetical protein
MSNDNFIAFQPIESSASFSDALTELVRNGAYQIIAEAVGVIKSSANPSSL